MSGSSGTPHALLARQTIIQGRVIFASLTCTNQGWHQNVLAPGLGAPQLQVGLILSDFISEGKCDSGLTHAGAVRTFSCSQYFQQCPIMPGDSRLGPGPWNSMCLSAGSTEPHCVSELVS